MHTLNNIDHIHFVGVGGIGMSAIAHVLLSMGKIVSGSDLNKNKNIEGLIEKGLKFSLGHSEENISTNTRTVVISTAIRDSNPELQKAKKIELLVLRRAQMLALITNEKRTVAVAGSHGKTTSSCYLAEILMNLSLRPSFIVGGVLKKVSNNANYDSDLFVIEADESDSSFHYLQNEYSIMTNIDNDHVDFYGSFERLKGAFLEFMQKNTKTCILNFDDQIIRDLSQRVDGHISFGSRGDEDYSFKIKKMKFGQSTLSLKFKEKEYEVVTNITGDYNLSNLVAAMAYALEQGVDIKEVQKAVLELKGIRRRYDILYKKETKTIIDDYAHHPTEIEKLINAVSLDYPGHKIRVFFEPHRFTRTQNFWDEFTTCFKQADEFYLFPIYAASEDPIDGVSSKKLLEEIINNEKTYVNSLGEIDSFIKAQQEKEVIISLGAGPISSEFRRVLGAASI